MYEIPKEEYGRGRRLLAGSIAAPLGLTAVPGLVTLLLLIVAAASPPTAALILFGGLIVTGLGLLTGLVISVILLSKRASWTRQMRERIAADGIKAEEIEWFRHELRANEKRMLKAVEARDLLLADAYRETLASRLTATRIIKSSRRELQLSKRRQQSLKQLRSARSEDFTRQIEKDIAKIRDIHEEAKVMQAEAEARLQLIEAAASRQGGLAESELALKKLSARSAELPLALESAKISEEIVRELESGKTGIALEPITNEAVGEQDPRNRLDE